jgi:hypothetical protein
MRKNKIARCAAVTAAMLALLAASGCGNPQDKLKSAAAAENGGKYREAAALYAALAIEAAPAHKLPDAQKGKVVQPALWQGELEKYVKWLTEPAAPHGGTLKSALDGLDRCATRFEADNTAHSPQRKPLDTLPAFVAQWNTAFNPPPPNIIDWEAIVKNAFNKKFSILQLSAPMNYTYDASIVSRKTSRRIIFTLYAENKILVPLPQGEYTMLVKSTVEFQKGQHWVSEYTAFPITVDGTPSLISMDLKTKVARKQ